MTADAARCEPEVVGFAARVATIVQEAREREALRHPEEADSGSSVHLVVDAAAHAVDESSGWVCCDWCKEIKDQECKACEKPWPCETRLLADALATALPDAGSPAVTEEPRHEPLTFEAIGEEIATALETHGFSPEVAQRMLTTYTLQVQAERLRKVASQLRGAAAPGYRSWVGTIDDEVQLITQKLQELE
jgi:hypothetical protein